VITDIEHGVAVINVKVKLNIFEFILIVECSTIDRCCRYQPKISK